MLLSADYAPIFFCTNLLILNLNKSGVQFTYVANESKSENTTVIT